MITQKLTGLHALLCPELIESGFRVFNKDRINILCSITTTGSFSYLKPTPNKALKKADAILPLTFHFGECEFYIYLFDGDVCAWATDENGADVVQGLPIWKAVQEFEFKYR